MVHVAMKNKNWTETAGSIGDVLEEIRNRLRGVSLINFIIHFGFFLQIAKLFVLPKHSWKAFHSDELHEEQIRQTGPRLLGLTVFNLSAPLHRVEEQETRMWLLDRSQCGLRQCQRHVRLLYLGGEFARCV